MTSRSFLKIDVQIKLKILFFICFIRFFWFFVRQNIFSDEYYFSDHLKFEDFSWNFIRRKHIHSRFWWFLFSILTNTDIFAEDFVRNILFFFISKQSIFTIVMMNIGEGSEKFWLLNVILMIQMNDCIVRSSCIIYSFIEFLR